MENSNLFFYSLANGQIEQVPAPSLPNELDGPMDSQCPQSFLIDSISSEWSKFKSDRKWTASCRKSLYTLSQRCYTFGPFKAHESIKLKCPRDGAWVGVRSMNDDKKEDRLWSFTCCPLAHKCKALEASFKTCYF